MPASFFDKIKLFKGAEIQPGRPPVETAEDEPHPTLLQAGCSRTPGRSSS